MDFRDFQDQRVKIYKNRKIKNCLLDMFSSRVTKKMQKIQKSGNFVFLDDFRVRQARALGINNCLILFTCGREMPRKPETFMIFRETPMDSYSAEHVKHIFVVFSLPKFVTRYCSNSSDEKTLKFNKKHQLHRLSKQSRVFKKEENP